ncbi:MAG TPA: hypothetical protein VEA40_26655 [Ramlibacter sp.]|nr:hypothetical protein [Ramlibacter sp.]
MNRNLTLAIAAAALVSGQAFATEVANWSPDAASANAYPALVQPQGAGKTRAEVQAERGAVRAGTVIHWSVDGGAEAFPALRQPGSVVAKSRDDVRAEARAVTQQRIATLREPLKFGA